MNWKTISNIEMRNREGEMEMFQIQYDGDFYRIQNEFGNMSFEFDVSSGHHFAEELISIISADIENEINSFLNEHVQSDNYDIDRQIGLFDNTDLDPNSSSKNCE